GMALQDGPPRLVRRRDQGGTPPRLARATLERRGAPPDVRLVPGSQGHARQGRHDASRPLEPAGAGTAEAPELMTNWDRLFDEVYLRTYAQLAAPEIAPAQAEGVVRLLGLEPGADLLDCPCGYGRHSIEFACLGLHAVGADRSEVLLGEAKRRAGDGEWPRFGQGDYREPPCDEASFACVTSLFRS